MHAGAVVNADSFASGMDGCAPVAVADPDEERPIIHLIVTLTGPKSSASMTAVSSSQRRSDRSKVRGSRTR